MEKTRGQKSRATVPLNIDENNSVFLFQKKALSDIESMGYKEINCSFNYLGKLLLHVLILNVHY
jgi:hypothetical protein